MESIEDLIRQIVRDEMAQGAVALSKAQAAEYLGGEPITEKTMDALVRRNEIGFAKVGRTTVFPVAALNEYIEKTTVRPVDNPWGLTDGALRHIREGRATRRRAPGPDSPGR